MEDIQRLREQIQGWSPAIESVRQRVLQVAHHDCSVLLHGESGVGKEVVAQQIHAFSRRRDKPFVAVDCATLSEGIFESQLFGHVRGAFTGADRDAVGFARTADGGTLFLDEIGELPLAVQAKLLRLLQQRTVVPVGDSRPVPVDVRVIAATHRGLAEMVACGQFREDLFYRLHVVTIHIPPLRERGDDVELLLRDFLGARTPPGGMAKDLDPEAWHAVRHHPWPGNVRELLNAAEAISVLCTGPTVGLDDLPEHIGASLTAPRRSSASPHERRAERSTDPVVLPDLTLDNAVRATLSLALKLTGGNKAQAAEMLGIDRKTLLRKIEKYEIDARNP